MPKDIENKIPANLKIKICQSALELIENEAARAKYVETGGVVAGTGNISEGEVILTHSSLPGPRAKATSYSFQHDREFCQQFLDELAIQTNGETDYLGEWHKHFERIPHPSSKDIYTLAAIARNSSYHVSYPLLLIIGSSNLRESLKVFVVNGTGCYDAVNWEIY